MQHTLYHGRWKVSSIIRATLIIAGAVLAIGSPGAFDQGVIGLGQAALQTIIGIAAIAVGMRMKGRKK